MRTHQVPLTRRLAMTGLAFGLIVALAGPFTPTMANSATPPASPDRTVDAPIAPSATDSSPDPAPASDPAAQDPAAQDPATPVPATAGPLLEPGDSGVDAGRVIALARPGAQLADVREEAQRAVKAAAPGGATVSVDRNTSRLVAIETSPSDAPAVIEELVASGAYEAVDYDVLRFSHAATLTPNDPLYTSQSYYLYGLSSGPGGSHFDEAWAAATNLNGSTDLAPVGVVDSAFDLSHPDLGENMIPGWDYGNSDADVSPDTADEGSDHGTNTSGIVAARADNRIGALGAAWNNRTLLYKTADYRDRLLVGAEAAAIVGATDAGVKVISISLGSESPSSVETAAIQYAFSHDVTVVASAGNSGDEAVDGVFNPVEYPAALPEVISVGGTNATGGHVSWATHNPQVELAAAAENVLLASTASYSGYTSGDGTSYSAPLVAAAAAMVLRERPGLSPTQVRTLLCETASDVVQAPATPGRDNYTGCGIVNARAALEKSRTVELFPTVTVAAPTVTLRAGEMLGLGGTAVSYPGPPLVAAMASTPLPQGVTLAVQGTEWALTGTPTLAGTYPVTIAANSYGRQTEIAVTIVVLPGVPTVFTLTVPTAIRNSTRFAPTLTATDAFGNAAPPAAEPVAFTYSVNPGCRFKRGAKPSYRSCKVTAQISTGVLAQQTVDVYDTSKFTKPKVTGVAKAGRKIKASIPSGWKHLSYQWYKNGKKIKGATSRVYTIPRRTSTKANYRVKVTIP
ncbi:MAG: S8 family serine peptidase, partial [Bifidobacteriaceae bacterium]|nr:S8 family serine peptidase [Bifidobacteriaceae bacterium]